MNSNQRFGLILAGMLLAGITTLNMALAQQKTPSLKASKMNTQATVIQRYLQARTAKKWQEAYQRLSPATQQRISPEFFQQVKELPTDPTADGMTPTLTAISVLFIDAPDSLGYRYTVVGPAPDDPNVVLVDAQPPAKVSKEALRLKIVTVGAPSAKEQPRIDMMKSMQQSDPAGFKNMAQWAQDRAKP